MEYRDFTIDLRSLENDRFEARVVQTPLQDWPRTIFGPPIARSDLDLLLRSFDCPSRAAPDPSLPTARQVGETLHAALFGAKIGELFARCRALRTPGIRTGLRLRLRFQWDDDQAEYLAALPWEWLWDPTTQEFLAVGRGTPIVRELSAAREPNILEVDPPLRILVVEAAPNTMKSLQLKTETARIGEALRPLIEEGHVELLAPEAATPDAVGDALRAEEVHVLHLMGHAAYDAESGTGAFFFVKEDSTEEEVDGVRLATYLKEIDSLRLVVLNSCRTARHKGGKGAPLSAGVAPAVLRHTQVPAVIANQCSISDRAAILLSRTLFGSLAAGDGIDQALTEARLNLKGRGREWGTPVLFLASPNGKLFRLKRVRRTHVRRIDPSGEPIQPDIIPRLVRPVGPSGEPLRLGVRSILGWGRDMEERNDAVLDLTKYFEGGGRFIKDQSLWQDKVFPDLREFLTTRIEERRALVLDFAAHSSIAFAAGWLLEPKSGLAVRVRQRTGGEGEFEWHPNDGTAPRKGLWLVRADLELKAHGSDVALALAVSQPTVAAEVEEFVRREDLPVGRLVEAAIAPKPGPGSVRGGAHALRLAEALIPRLLPHRPHERDGRTHVFCAAPNALVFYLGQLMTAIGRSVLYEYPFRVPGSHGQYRKSIELPPPDEVPSLPPGW